MMKGYRIGLGVSGGIAAYKAIEVMRQLQKAGCGVRVAMTRHATEFIRPLTFRALSKGEVVVDDYDPENSDPIAHINFSQNIDLLLVVPATANIIAKFANGIADDFLSSTYLASTAPVLLAPAMNTVMWEHPATRRNVETLKKDGVRFVEPISGELACRVVGTGKLEDVENIVKQALGLLRNTSKEKTGLFPFPHRQASEDSSESGTRLYSNGTLAAEVNSGENLPVATLHGQSMDLKGERLLITVGGTREAIDPVRFISNHSSGKMGFAIAEAASKRGAEVTVVAGVTSVAPPENVRVLPGISAEEMHAAVMRELPNTTIFIGAAAVADYRPASAAAAKIKKEGRDSMTLELKKTPDILADVAKNRSAGLLVVGFAAETSDVVAYARSKMEKKGLDMVVANDITAKGAGFNTDTNIATIITNHGDDIELPLMPKREMADTILDEVLSLRNRRQLDI